MKSIRLKVAKISCFKGMRGWLVRGFASLSQIIEWMKVNKLTISFEKTNFVPFAHKINSLPNFNEIELEY